jgi:hypothetical protein
MPNTYVALATTTVSANAGPITFTSIPATYTDLVLVISGTQATSGTVRIQFNNDTASNYSRTDIYGDGSSAASYRESNQTYINFITLQTTQSNSITHIMNYANTTTFKTAITRYNTPSTGVTAAGVMLWRKTPEAIHTITLTNTSNVTGTFSLYGVANADQGAAKATGGIITEDSQYWYHTFGVSGAFVPKQSLTCDYLVVAGGGGGGGQQGGGGGAGGLRAFASASFTATSYAVTIGSGGPGGFGNISRGTNGNNSTFNSNSVTGGGGGATNAIAAGSGGSGGGGGINSSANGSGNAGSYSPVEGFAGGATSSGDGGGGGGGAGAAGVAKNSSGNGRDGGTGVSVYNSIDFSTWLTAAGISSSGKLAGGGGGGTSAPYIVGIGGAGGGGTGGNVEQQQPLAYQHGQANTGGGAGGGSQFNANAYGGNGGSGVVIVRYAK